MSDVELQPEGGSVTKRCLICGHEPCPHCEAWCDLVGALPNPLDPDGDPETFLCCDGACVYTKEALLEWMRKSPEDLVESIVAAAKFREADRGAGNALDVIVLALEPLSDDERHSVLGELSMEFCIHCGQKQPESSHDGTVRTCQCWNDE
jgi:hypothetical protein